VLGGQRRHAGEDRGADSGQAGSQDGRGKVIEGLFMAAVHGGGS
jgi:hypothetical protein